MNREAKAPKGKGKCVRQKFIKEVGVLGDSKQALFSQEGVSIVGGGVDL